MVLQTEAKIYRLLPKILSKVPIAVHIEHHGVESGGYLGQHSATKVRNCEILY